MAAKASVQRLARAKINLALHVTGRRADGYHLLDSLVAFADLGDLVTVEPADRLSLRITGPMAAGLSAGGDNLVLRAALAIQAGQAGQGGHLGQGAAIMLDKHLPIASGIGGGSADAAATLQALVALWGCALPGPQAVLALGADLPVCLSGRPARMTGIGEVLTPLALPHAHLVLVNPGFGLATALVFRALTRRDNPALPPPPPALPDAAALADYLRLCRNDLEPPARRLAPGIDAVLAALSAQDGCLLARMSGSGATCFGLFARADRADVAARTLSGDHPGWWVRAAPLAA